MVDKCPPINLISGAHVSVRLVREHERRLYQKPPEDIAHLYMELTVVAAGQQFTIWELR